MTNCLRLTDWSRKVCTCKHVNMCGLAYLAGYVERMFGKNGSGRASWTTHVYMFTRTHLP